MRFPEFSGEWEIYPLTDFMSFKNGMNPDAKRFGRGTKFISVMDILNNQFICYDNIRASVEVVDGDIETYGVNYGDILFQRSSETLEDVGQANVYLDSKPAVFGGFVIRGKSKSNYYPMFFRYLLASPTARKKIIVKGAGAQHFNIGQDGLSKVCLNIPSIQEQEKIAKLFECIDTRIATQNKIIEKLQSLIKGLNDNIHKGIKGETVCFSDLGEAYSGLSGKGGDDFGYGEPFITYMNVYQNTYISEKDYELVQIAPNEKQNSVQYGDALFTLSSETPEEVGIGAVYLGNTQKLYLNSFCFGIHFYDERVLPQYLAHFISSSSFRRAIYPLAQGSTRFNLQKNDFMKMKFLLPSLEKQGHIANTLDALHCRLANEKSLTEQYILLKKYLLSLMFI
ncbi:MAG: restriction endonuclease subunit S [Bacteroides sp.]|uniref:restriction endonuclease subunit S n=1 Tax=Bacteroides sp. MSK.20.82 TaxID=2849174 RepID=UPI0020B7EE19|nr:MULTISPECIES: restriction endonuclease subunit S [Bacteroidaceae]MDU6665297.1 restriction endonuclease subunit S [Bacteroides sp.]